MGSKYGYFLAQFTPEALEQDRSTDRKEVNGCCLAENANGRKERRSEVNEDHHL
jgi:hypothetical protein